MSGENSQETDIGTKIRAIRKQRKLSLQKLGERVGLTAGFLSQIESGGSNASIGSLKQIANGLGVKLAELFDDASVEEVSGGSHRARRTSVPNAEVVRANHRKMLVWPGADGREYLLTPDLHRKLQVQLSIMEPGHGSGDAYVHPVEDGEEFGFVIEGTLEVVVGDDVHVLHAGDSIYFLSDIPHRMRVVGEATVRAVWVTTPPSF